MQAADGRLRDVLTGVPRAQVLESHRARGYELSVQLIERAKAEGTLRPDVVPEDLALLLMANAGVVQAGGAAAPDAWRRFVALMLDGLRTEGASPLPPPLTARQVMRAMRRLAKSSDEPRSTP